MVLVDVLGEAKARGKGSSPPLQDLSAAHCRISEQGTWLPPTGRGNLLVGGAERERGRREPGKELAREMEGRRRMKGAFFGVQQNATTSSMTKKTNVVPRFHPANSAGSSQAEAGSKARDAKTWRSGTKVRPIACPILCPTNVRPSRCGTGERWPPGNSR